MHRKLKIPVDHHYYFIVILITLKAIDEYMFILIREFKKFNGCFFYKIKTNSLIVFLKTNVCINLKKVILVLCG